MHWSGKLLLCVSIVVLVFVVFYRYTTSLSHNDGATCGTPSARSRLPRQPTKPYYLSKSFPLQNVGCLPTQREAPPPHTVLHAGQTYSPPRLPPTEEFNDIRTFDITELPFLTEDLKIKNCVSAELLRAVIPRGEYTIDETENNFSITGPSGSQIITIPVQDYSIVELCLMIELLIKDTGTSVFADSSTFACTYDYGRSTTKFAHLGGENFTIKFDKQLAYSMGFTHDEHTSTTGELNGMNRVDLFGSRTVQIRTNMFEPAHHKGIMQDLHIANELTLWENNTDIRWAERRFRLPHNVGNIKFSIMTRHPSQTQESDYKQLALNGVVAHLTVCFRRKRYSTTHLANQELELS